MRWLFTPTCRGLHLGRQVGDDEGALQQQAAQLEVAMLERAGVPRIGGIHALRHTWATLALERGTASQLTSIAYEVAPNLDPADLQKSLADHGIKSEIRSDTAPGIAKALVFDDPDGHRIELFSRWEFCKAVEPIRGLAVAKLGHVALHTPDPERTAAFFGDVLGFRVSDRIEENFVFMRCGPEHHAMNFARGTDGRLHHLAFELRDASHMHQACDLLGRNRP